jgi:hypothetical protein
MSFSGREAQSFFAPLRGRTATFMLEDRRANLDFARTILSLLGQTSDGAAILDLDAFYSSNSDRIFKPLDPTVAQETVVRVPEPGADIEEEFSAIFEATQRVVIIDSINSFYHLISQEDGASRGRKLNFAIASLTYLARTNGKAAILTMYRREGFPRGAPRRSISGLTDITASASFGTGEMTVRVERGHGWEGGTFSIRIP